LFPVFSLFFSEAFVAWPNPPLARPPIARPARARPGFFDSDLHQTRPSNFCRRFPRGNAPVRTQPFVNPILPSPARAPLAMAGPGASRGILGAARARWRESAKGRGLSLAGGLCYKMSPPGLWQKSQRARFCLLGPGPPLGGGAAPGAGARAWGGAPLGPLRRGFLGDMGYYQGIIREGSISGG
jgi:hypothetical protein